ncbi:MAG: hypothetical protein QOF30_2860 [Acidimicrobiaceae bacterium]|nr:hypothetical protein [Acidimicrobiaceae bacterium]
MKVAMVLPSLAGGGAQRVFLDVASGLLSRGVTVDIVAAHGDGPLRSDVPDGARLIALDVSRVALMLPPLVRYLRRARPDVVLSCLNHTNLVSIAAGRLTRPRTPVVITHHNHLSTSARHKVARRDRGMPVLLHFALPLADRVVAVSRGVADDLASTTGYPRSRIEVVYNPVIFDNLLAASHETLEHPWLLQKEAPVVLAIGRLVEQKDFETLIRAIALMPECRLIILGEGERRPMLERLVTELKLADRVDLPGFVSNPFPYFRAADTLALSSRWEGLPTVLIEALPFDLSIVATDCHSGPREILEDGRWGRLVPVGDVAALAGALTDAVTERAQPRSEACARYDLAEVTERYLDLLSANG